MLLPLGYAAGPARASVLRGPREILTQLGLDERFQLCIGHLGLRARSEGDDEERTAANENRLHDRHKAALSLLCRHGVERGRPSTREAYTRGANGQEDEQKSKGAEAQYEGAHNLWYGDAAAQLGAPQEPQLHRVPPVAELARGHVWMLLANGALGHPLRNGRVRGQDGA